MSSSSPNKSPFAARASTRAPFPPHAEGRPADPAPTVASVAGSPRKGPGLITALIVAVLVAACAGIFFVTRKGEAPPVPAKSSVEKPAAPAAPAEPVETKVARLAMDFATVQAKAVGLPLGEAARSALAEATLLAGEAQARADAKDFAAAARAWERAVAAAGPAVFSGVSARYDIESAVLGDLRAEDQSAASLRSLAKARDASDEAASRKDWVAAISARDEARALLPAARKALGSQLADAAKGAVTRGDATMATLFHERALRLDPSLESSREYLYRNKFKAGQVLRTPMGIELAYAPPAEFTRGSPVGEPARDSDEPQQRVILTRGFFIGVNETSQAEWDRVMGAGSALKTLRAAKAKPEMIAPELPMHSVTWEQAAGYCRRLSELDGLAFRLPTEAEWEYACRAGTATAFNSGADGLSARDANIDDGTAAAPLAPRPPGTSGRPNAWGLRDMHGNVWEWCADWSAPYPVSAKRPVDPSGPTRESLGRIDLAMKVVRGGGWNAPANDARSANRWEYAPAVATPYIGFRVVHDPDLVR